jgi:hypothetical protein
MFWQKRRRLETGTLALAVGAAVGTAAAVYLGVRQLRARRAQASEALPERLAEIEAGTVEALRKDEITGHRPIDVAALAAGIIELTGVVGNLEEAHHAVDIAQRVEGVHTVINRLTLGDVEEHLAETRNRLRQGDAALQETQWYGMNAGMGRRRQSTATDPSRRDDRNDAISRVLEPDAVDEFTEETATGSVSELNTEADRPPIEGRREIH